MTQDATFSSGIVYLDSADAQDATRAAQLGYITGITTNPTLMASTGYPPLEKLTRLLEAFPGPIFYQLTHLDAERGRWEAARAIESDSKRVVLKIPVRSDLFGLAAALVSAGVTCTITAVYSPAQTLLASQLGASWVISYVDRARRLLDDGTNLVPRRAEVLARQLGTKILGASIKSPDQAVSAIRNSAGGEPIRSRGALSVDYSYPRYFAPVFSRRRGRFG
jgi:transaldolase